MKTIHWVEEAAADEQRKLIEEEVRAKLETELRESGAAPVPPPAVPAATTHIMRTIIMAAAGVLVIAAIVLFAVHLAGRSKEPNVIPPTTLEKIQPTPPAAESPLDRLKQKSGE